MKQFNKGIVYKTINVTAVTSVIMIVLAVYGYLYGEQRGLATEVYKVREDVMLLKQTPVVAQLVVNTKLIEQQRKQIEINTKTLAVLDIQYHNIEKKLDQIYSMVKDNNDKIDRHIESELRR
jgi:hypothetical protein